MAAKSKTKNKAPNIFPCKEDQKGKAMAKKRKRKTTSKSPEDDVGVTDVKRKTTTWDVDQENTNLIFHEMGVTMLAEDSLDRFPAPTPKIVIPQTIEQPGAPRIPLSQTSNSSFDIPSSYEDETPHKRLALDDFLCKRARTPVHSEGTDIFSRLSDEIMLSIFQWFPKTILVKCARVCKRWKRVSFDESLWRRLDLASKSLEAGVIGRVLQRGVTVLRLAKAEVNTPLFMTKQILPVPVIRPPSKVQYLDLSMTVISEGGLEELLGTCQELKKLSLENAAVNDKICSFIAKNKELEVLNLCMCQGITANGIYNILIECPRLESLNLAWTHLSKEAILTVVLNLPRGLLRLNLTGTRETLSDDDVLNLTTTCPHLKELDLSDATMLTSTAVQNVSLHLRGLEYIGFSRCYKIMPVAFKCLSKIYTLLALDVFGMMKDTSLVQLQEHLKNIQLNKYPFSSIARPTTGIRRTSIWGLRVRDQVIA